MTDVAEELAGALDGQNIEETPENEETPAVESQPEAKAEPEVKAEDEKPGPIPGLLEERRRRQELERVVKEKEESYNAQLKELENRLRAEWEAKQNPKEEITYDGNPAEYLRLEIEQLKEKFNQEGEGLKKRTEQIEQQTQQERQIKEIQGKLLTFESEYHKQNDDYYDALNYVKAIEMDKYKMLGYAKDDADRNIDHALFQTAIVAMQAERNPAEYMYEIAKRMGYKKEKISDADAQKLDQLQKSQDAAKSLSSNGLPDDGEPEEPEDEFSSAWNTAMKEIGILR